MAFITNQKGAGAKKLGERLGELMGHEDRLKLIKLLRDASASPD